MIPVDSELVRCPQCKGTLTPAGGALRCAPCRTSHPWLAELEAWDLRGDLARAATARSSAASADAATRGDATHATRLWSALRAVHGELPRQGVVAWLDPADPRVPLGLEDSFARSVLLATSPARLLGGTTSRHALVALVDPAALPLASGSIDLVDGSIAGTTEPALVAELAEIHRVLAPRGHAYLVQSRAGARVGAVECAARGAFAEGFGWVPPAGWAGPGGERLASFHRHLQMWLGFEYTLGRGIRRARPGTLTRWLRHASARRELVCWRTRPDRDEWKQTPSHVPMVFGRFHFPDSASPT